MNAKIYHKSLYGKRKEKLKFLNENSTKTVEWKELELEKEYAFFVPKDFSLQKEYEEGFKIDNLYKIFGSGIKFRKDNLLVNFSKESAIQMVLDVRTLDNNHLLNKYNFKETPDWRIDSQRNNFQNLNYKDEIKPVLYRPFDIRYTYYPLDLINKIIPRGDSRKNLMRNMLTNNLSLITSRQFGSGFHFISFLTNILCEISSQPNAPYMNFPLYIYNSDGTKTPNFNPEIANKIYSSVGQVTPENILDYIYAVLYTPSYREKYKEFLKIDFPRVPYPENKEKFMELANIGTRLRELHLMTAQDIENGAKTRFNVAGSNIVEKVSFDFAQDDITGKVYINSEQYFEGVSENAWKFYIGGYQPLQKYLKDRKGRELTFDEVDHYRKVVFVIEETMGWMRVLDGMYNIG
jgi:predicted helicase